MISVPTTGDVSLDALRSFFKAYLSHKQFVDYMINLTVVDLVDKNWIIHSRANDTYMKLMLLQKILNFNVNKLFILVRQSLICVEINDVLLYSLEALVILA